MLLSVSSFFEQPIPRKKHLKTLPLFRSFPVDLNRPESKEPLVDALAAGLPGRSIYAQTDGWNAPYRQPLPGAPQSVWVRKTVLEKLLRVNELLSTLNVELYLLDGYRTIECQQGIYDWMKAQIEQEHPDYTPEEVRELLRNFISDPSTFSPTDSTTWTSHITGGAIDLTLRHKPTGTLLEMGGVFDDPSIISFTDFYEDMTHPFAHSATFTEARRNRRLLFHAMRTQNFTSLPAEWWHYDFGEQLWSRNSAHYPENAANPHPVAFYGPTQLP